MLELKLLKSTRQISDLKVSCHLRFFGAKASSVDTGRGLRAPLSRNMGETGPLKALISVILPSPVTAWEMSRAQNIKSLTTVAVLWV